MKTPRRRPRRLLHQERRQQLIGCAVKAFARHGFARAGHSHVAREARVAASTVFAHFRNRDELLRAVLGAVAHYFEQLASRHHQPNTPAPRALLEHAIAVATSVDTDPDYARLLLEWSTAIREDMWADFLHLQDRILHHSATTIRRGQEDGSIPGHLDADSSALMLLGSALQLIQMSFGSLPPEKAHRFLLAQLRGAIGADAVTNALS